MHRGLRFRNHRVRPKPRYGVVEVRSMWRDHALHGTRTPSSIQVWIGRVHAFEGGRRVRLWDGDL